MLDRPVWKDWVFYLWLIGLAAGVVAPHSTVFDLVFNLVVQTLIFLVIPGTLRAFWRRRKTNKKASRFP